MKLQTLLTNNKGFQKLPTIQKTIFLEMADAFQKDHDNLARYPEELAIFHPPFTTAQWSQFIDLEPTRQFIRKRMQDKADVAERKLFQMLENEALGGNVNAARELKSFVQKSTGSDKTVVILHSVPRPKTRDEVKKNEV